MNNIFFKMALLVGVFSTTSIMTINHSFADDTGKTIAILPPTGNGKLPNPLPSGVIGNPQTPLSSQKMPLSMDKINEQVQRVIKESNERLQDVKIGDGNMPDVHEDIGVLKSQIQTDRMLREMKFQKEKVDSAISLWKSSFDGKREEEKSKNQNNNSSNMIQQPNSNGMFTNPSMQSNNDNDLANEAAKKQKELEDAKAKEEDDKKRHAQFILERRKLAASIEPVISSIYGSPTNLQAVILIPYIGSKNITANSTFQYIDGSIGRVVKLGDDSIIVSHNGKKTSLIFGNSVPSRSELVTFLNDEPSKVKNSNGLNSPNTLRK